MDLHLILTSSLDFQVALNLGETAPLINDKANNAVTPFELFEQHEQIEKHP